MVSAVDLKRIPIGGCLNSPTQGITGFFREIFNSYCFMFEGWKTEFITIALDKDVYFRRSFICIVKLQFLIGYLYDVTTNWYCHGYKICTALPVSLYLLYGRNYFISKLIDEIFKCFLDDGFVLWLHNGDIDAIREFFNELPPSLKIEVEKGKGSYEQNLTHLCNFNIFR